jgi:hypothetical protein
VREGKVELSEMWERQDCLPEGGEGRVVGNGGEARLPS